MIRECLYVTLFAPRPKGPMITKEGSLKPARTPVRPVLIALDGGEDGRILEEGDAGVATFTLFGPAIEYLNLHLEIAGSSLQSLPLNIKRNGPAFAAVNEPGGCDRAFGLA